MQLPAVHAHIRNFAWGSAEDLSEQAACDQNLHITVVVNRLDPVWPQRGKGAAHADVVQVGCSGLVGDVHRVIAGIPQIGKVSFLAYPTNPALVVVIRCDCDRSPSCWIPGLAVTPRG